MLKTQGMPNVIREGNTPMLRSIIQGGRASGMQSMDDAIVALLEAKKITAEAAFAKAHDKMRFEKLVKAN